MHTELRGMQSRRVQRQPISPSGSLSAVPPSTRRPRRPC